jgi:hypothetical protein
MTIWNIANYYRVCPDQDVISNFYFTQNSRSRTNVYVIANDWWTTPISGSDRHLLKHEAIHPNCSIGMDNYSVWVRYQQSSADSCIQGNICSSHNTPEAICKNNAFLKEYAV